MMKLNKIIISLLISSFSFSSLAMTQQEVVTYLNQKSTANLTHSSHSLLKTGNSALHWTSLKGPQLTASMMKVIQAINNPNYLIIFNPDAISFFQSQDSGQHWQETFLPKNTNLYDLISLNNDCLLLAANNGMYLFQANQWIYLPNGLRHANHLFRLNSNSIYAQAPITTDDRYRIVFVSHDEGKSWQASSMGLQLSSEFTKMSGYGNVLAISEYNGISVSTDGGQMWKQPSKNWEYFYEDSGFSLAVSSKSEIYTSGIYQRGDHEGQSGLFKTDVLGKNWEKIASSYNIKLDKDDNLYVESLTKIDDNKYQIAIYKSIDGGRYWQLLYRLNPDDYLDDMTILDNGKIILSTDKGLLLSDDTQKNYSLLPTSLTISEITSVLRTDGNIFAINNYKTLYKSHDQGKTWQNAYSGEARSVVRFKDKLILASKNHLLMSQDEGETWQQVYQFNDDISALNSNSEKAWVVVSKDRYLSSDLKNWKKFSKGYSFESIVDTFTKNRIYEAQQIDRNSGFGNDCFIKISDDEGVTWATLLANFHQKPDAIASYNVNTILVAFYVGGIIKSSDGGKNWEVINNGLNEMHFNQLMILDENNYLAMSENGVFRTQDGGKHWIAETDGLDNPVVLSADVYKNTFLVGTGGSGVYQTTF